MITLPNLFVPLLALLGAGVFVFGAWARARAGEARLAGRLAALEQRVGEQQQALERAEAARAAAEADLRATEQRYLIALRGSQDGLWEWDIASGAVHLSPRWKGMLGFESHQLADDLAAWRGRVHEDDRAGFEQALADHLAGRRRAWTTSCACCMPTAARASCCRAGRRSATSPAGPTGWSGWTPTSPRCAACRRCSTRWPTAPPAPPARVSSRPWCSTSRGRCRSTRPSSPSAPTTRRPVYARWPTGRRRAAAAATSSTSWPAPPARR
ncbi:MAG: PAS domain-containing protein [Piscinibacter sp.]|nr:PAS domain-containing protein [Piscinibacter sp.]